MRQVFDHPQVLHRRMRLELEHPAYGSVPTLGPAVKYSGFDVTQGWSAPPMLDEHRGQVLADWLAEPETAGTTGATP